VNLNSQGSDLSDVSLANVEALAGCEVSGWTGGNYWHITIYTSCSWTCTQGGVLQCPI
jgi:hypothetical protein